jgi:hypothetical protein
LSFEDKVKSSKQFKIQHEKAKVIEIQDDFTNNFNVSPTFMKDA